MKILWVKSDFLHPTTRGGQIRTLEMLRRLHTRHEIHYVAFDDPSEPDGVRRSREYCAKSYPIPHRTPPRRSLRFVAQLVRGLWVDEPVSIRRYRSVEMRGVIERLSLTEKFDCIVCDFLTPAVNLPDMSRAVLFQHNVESMIWERYAHTASNPLASRYFRRQADRMRAFEGSVCAAARYIVAVSASDVEVMRSRFGVSRIAEIPTGVDIDWFGPRPPIEHVADLVFVGSMDWLPNIDGMRFFISEVLPIIRRSRPDCSLAIVGRRPSPEILAFARRDSNVAVTGTVDDVRPYLWGSTVSVVPLRIGGGTRLKIYEAMAARIPVVSTTIGAEGLDVTAPSQIRLADTADRFAAECLALLNDRTAREEMASDAWNLVASHFSWETVASRFESILARTRT